jgi:glycosyltransferase involved in cell wall biosynthesis
MKFIFWFSVAVILYAYIGYPFILYIFSLFSRKKIQRDARYIPFISLIITVYNEQDRIQKKIDNTLALDYPHDKLEIIFASDASTDKTDEIIQSHNRFKLVRSFERRGKEFAQKCAIDQASGEILIFSDVATIIAPEGLRKIIENFADPTVGCVSSEDRIVDEEGKMTGEGAYVKYEMFLRRLETKVSSLVGLSGSFFAARKEVCANWSVDLQSDFNTLLNSLKLGLRGVSDPHTLGCYRNISDEKKEFIRKVRTVLRGLWVIRCNLAVLNPFHFKIFSWELISHKLCRWLVPFLLISALVSNCFLIKVSFIYMTLLIVQILFYLLAFFYLVLYSKLFPCCEQSIKNNNFLSLLINILRIPYYFIIVNSAILMAWINFFRGKRSIYWEPSKR